MNDKKEKVSFYKLFRRFPDEVVAERVLLNVNALTVTIEGGVATCFLSGIEI